jgi:hypothetical protein
VLLFLLWAASFLGPAWTNSSKQPGTRSDADFFWLFQTNVMLWLNTIIVVSTLLNNPHGQLESWAWQWAWVALAIILPVVSFPLYLYVSTPLGMTLVFLGSAAQAAVVLQGMLSAGKIKTD